MIRSRRYHGGILSPWAAIGVGSVITAIVAAVWVGIATRDRPGSLQPVDGPRYAVYRLCGQELAPPPNGSRVTWFTDITKPSSGPLQLPALPHLDGRSTSWVQLTHNCAQGAAVQINPSGHIKIIDTIHATTHRYVAVQFYAYARGSVTVTSLDPSGKALGSLTIHVN